jgi:class 3 adenylate cyclase
MPAEVKKEIQLEIAHVLFIDIVGYSKLLINEQRSLLDTSISSCVTRINSANAEAAGRLLKIPTGDGMALVFYKSPEEPVECALEISRATQRTSGAAIANGGAQRACQRRGRCERNARMSPEPASTWPNASWIVAMPDTFCCRSTSLKI